MAVRKLQEMGENLQLIVKRLLANQTLLKLLYYSWEEKAMLWIDRYVSSNGEK